jgi:phage gp46-like protein
MSDLALRWNSATGTADLAIEDDDFAADESLETAVMLSLWTGSAGGWWGDVVSDTAGDKFGSKLYLLAREKDTARVLDLAKAYVEEALAWMIEDLVASSVACVAESQPYGAGQSVLALSITITRPSVAPVTYRYAYNWEAQELRHAV